MKRPNQHIIEEKSMKIFKNIVPDEWVCKEIRPDYGIDYLVEIFENNLSTGKTFFVQLKGSEQEIDNDVFTKQFSTDHLDYYKSLALPVLIVCVSTITKQIWGIWANRLIDHTSLKDEQQSLSLSLPKKYILDKTKFKVLASQIEIASKLGLNIESKSELTNYLKNHILSWVEHFYSDSVSIKFNNLPKHLNIKLSQLNSSIKVNIEIGSFTKNIEITNLKLETPFLHRPKFDHNEINEFNNETLLYLAISLAKHDITGSLNLLIEIVDKIEFSDPNKTFEIDPFGLLTIAKEQKKLHLFNRLVQKIVESKNFELFRLFDLASFILSSPEIETQRIQNLELVLKSKMDNQSKGTCHYNIGNILKSRSGEGIHHYIKAARLYPDYKNRDYWWREIAGLFFLDKHYLWAEICYKKSIKLSKKERTSKYLRVEKSLPKIECFARLADCLFQQGKFKEANKYFEKYFASSESSPQEWILKNMTCLELKDSPLNNVKFDRKKSFNFCEKAIASTDDEETIDFLTKATEYHPTNGLAWFNLGVSLDRANRPNEALFAFLNAGLIVDSDQEAQFNTLTISFSQKLFDMMQAILIFLTEKYGKNVINDLTDYLMTKPMPLEAKKEAIKLFNKMLNIASTLSDRT